MKEELSFRAYSRRRGCSHTAIQNAIKAGRLSRCLVKRGKRILIDPAIADAELAKNTDPAFQREPESRGGGAPKGTAPPNAGKPNQGGLYGPEVERASEEQEADDPSRPSLHSRRAELVGIQADMARLDLEEKTGLLVRAAEVSAEYFKLGRQLRDAILQIPAREYGALMEERDPVAFQQALATVLLRALEAFATERPAPHA